LRDTESKEEYFRAYQVRNKERLKEYNKTYHAENKERRREREKSNSKLIQERRMRYATENWAKIQQYRLENQEEKRKYNRFVPSLTRSLVLLSPSSSASSFLVFSSPSLTAKRVLCRKEGRKERL
jgi:hypothetical protein